MTSVNEEIQQNHVYTHPSGEALSFNPKASSLAGGFGPIQSVQVTDLRPSEFCKSIYDLSVPQDLVDSIEEHGVLVPILVTPENKIMSGHRRVDACRRLGRAEIPAQVVADIDSLSIEANRQREKTLVECLAEVKALKTILAEKAKARQIVGKKLDLASTLDQGRVMDQVAKHLRMSRGTTAKLFEIQEKKPELLKNIDAKKQSINGAFKFIRRAERREANQQKRLKEGIASSIKPHILKGDFRELAKKISDHSISAIITDPPYPKEFLPLWEDLGEVAQRVLKPGGFLVAYSGQMHLPTVIKMLGKHLSYQWMGAMLHTPGGHARVHAVGAIAGWKPYLVYSNGPSTRFKHKSFGDVLQGTGKDKDLHKWGQDLEPFKDLVRQFTDEGDQVWEPFAGGGTSIEACMLLGREIVAHEIDPDAYSILEERFLKNRQ